MQYPYMCAWIQTSKALISIIHVHDVISNRGICNSINIDMIDVSVWVKIFEHNCVDPQSLRKTQSNREVGEA